MLNRQTAAQLRDRLLGVLSGVWFQVQDDGVIHDPLTLEQMEPEHSFVEGEPIYIDETEREWKVLIHLHHGAGTWYITEGSTVTVEPDRVVVSFPASKLDLVHERTLVIIRDPSPELIAMNQPFNFDSDDRAKS